ncbi:hypothetical protein EVG20_g10424 [Dentipellis fragilis]|uniref:Uncharacterized protein n=1 Tax=Dentipellis fragilis TaxID=205917 RepID=A0A4Y9XSL2_9AGAM|nr:hypothetical protein EVG20_g10424 [Dentipellis fragilis]
MPASARVACLFGPVLLSELRGEVDWVRSWITLSARFVIVQALVNAVLLAARLPGDVVSPPASFMPTFTEPPLSAPVFVLCLCASTACSSLQNCASLYSRALPAPMAMPATLAGHKVASHSPSALHFVLYSTLAYHLDRPINSFSAYLNLWAPADRVTGAAAIASSESHRWSTLGFILNTRLSDFSSPSDLPLGCPVPRDNRCAAKSASAPMRASAELYMAY